jgi:hypothetical protein
MVRDPEPLRNTDLLIRKTLFKNLNNNRFCQLLSVFLLRFQAGLPDGIFSNQKSQFGNILDVLGMEKVGIFYGHKEYITVIWYILYIVIWQFWIFSTVFGKA